MTKEYREEKDGAAELQVPAAAGQAYRGGRVIKHVTLITTDLSSGEAERLADLLEISSGGIKR